MNIILTGASRGIGYQTALELCKRGAKKIALISRNETALIELAKECIKVNAEVDVVILAEDLSNLTIEKAPLKNILAWETCDILINNAGLLTCKPFLELTEAEMTKMFEINVFSPSRLVRELYPILKRSSSSHVLNISSMGGYQGSSKYPGLSYYSASKAAIANLTECLAEEFKNTNIKFNCLALGAVQTEMLNEAFPGYKAPVTSRKMGEYIAHFAINGHSYYNGQILPVTLSNP